MADRIQLLPDHVANQIAAGEVVQRPASVVKELMENAIDAEADKIQLIIKDAGKTLIQVVDNGRGMSTTDARMSFERHATSKIKDANDLFKIQTKGFRGEALASIAAIAHVEMKTKQQDDELGTLILIEGSEIKDQTLTACVNGTSVAVKNLFYNVPARRNFLKSDAVELRHIIDEFHRVALAHPHLEFHMHHNNSELFNLPKSNHRQRIVNVFGGKTNEKLVPIEEQTQIVKLSGFVGKPEFAKRTRGEQFFFVNDRFIKSSYLNHAVNSAFEGLLRDGSHASYFIFLEVDPSTIDVNIHPTKTEIKFEDEHSLYSILRSCVKHSLGQFNVAPALDFERDSSMDTPYAYQGKSINAPKIEVDHNYNPFTQEKTGGSFQKRNTDANWESLYVGLKDNTPSEGSSFTIESDPENLKFFDDQHKKELKAFQIHNKYIVNAIKSGLVVIDQNRAHQRILYESFLEQLTIKEAVSQQLLFPIKLKFNTIEIATLEGMKDQLGLTGFQFSELSQEGVELSGIPIGIEEKNIEDVLFSLIKDTDNQIPGVDFSQNDLIAKSMAKSLSIKAGTSLGYEEMEHLINSLFACKEPELTPDFKKTFVTISSDELQNKFS